MTNTTDKRLLIYVAGPYLAVPPTGTIERKDLHKCVRETALNTERAIHAGIEIMKLGHVVVIPHLSHYIHTLADVEFDNEYWYDFDNAILDKCDALYVVSTTGINGVVSKGTVAEIARAKANGLQIFAKIEDIPKYVKNVCLKCGHAFDDHKYRDIGLFTCNLCNCGY